MKIGVVLWFDHSKGFGKIGTPDGLEYFFRRNHFHNPNDSENVEQAKIIKFLPTEDALKRSVAKNCSLSIETSDIPLFFEYIGDKNTVNVQIGMGKHSQYRKVDVVSTACSPLLIRCSEQEIINLVRSFYFNGLKASKFIAFCEYLEKILGTSETIKDVELLQRNLFSFFSENITPEILFTIWLKKKFQYIDRAEYDDYEIPIEVLTLYKDRLDLDALQRVKSYSYGGQFVDDLIITKVYDFIDAEFDEIDEVEQLINILSDNVKRDTFAIFQSKVFSLIRTRITSKISETVAVINESDFQQLKNLKSTIPPILNNDQQKLLEDIITNSIKNKATEEFRVNLWLKNYLGDIPDNALRSYLKQPTSISIQTDIIEKKYPSERLKVILMMAELKGWQSALNTLAALFKRLNPNSEVTLKEICLGTPQTVWFELSDLIEELKIILGKTLNEDDALTLFFEGWIKVSDELLLSKVSTFSNYQCAFIAKQYSHIYSLEVLQNIFIQNQELHKTDFVNIVASKLNATDLQKFTLTIIENSSEEEYYEFWQLRYLPVIPKDIIIRKIKTGSLSKRTLSNWIDNKLLPEEKLISIIHEELLSLNKIKGRVLFYHAVHLIKTLHSFNSRLTISDCINEDDYNLIIWYINDDVPLNFDILKNKFVYFDTEDQVTVLKKLFWLMEQGKLNVSPENFNSIIRIDLDVYNSIDTANAEAVFDISSDIILTAVDTFSRTKKFLVQAEIFPLLLRNMKGTPERRFKLSHYFEDCRGRASAKINWDKYDGMVSKVNYENDRFYYAISFSPGETVWVNNRKGGFSKFEPNHDFERLRHEVKQLPGVKWNVDAKHWGVPSKYENFVLNFARTNQFKLHLTDNSIKDNLHLVELSRGSQPAGVYYCEGRQANQSHKIFDREFWWCAGKQCFDKCETPREKKKWNDYSLLDFLEILGINTDEINSVGDTISHGKYYQFVHLINRFNLLLERLYCNCCNHILYPAETGDFTAHTVIRFRCVNGECLKKDEIVYLNHCLNGQCNNIIDSREVKSCPNGLFICGNCGCCCSHAMFKRRADNLTTVGRSISRDLSLKIQEKLGHLERGEYYCFKGHGKMEETSTDKFTCPQCQVEYDTKGYNFSRPHQHLNSL